MPKATLLFYINAIHEGGAERVIIQVARHFALCGYKSILVTSYLDKNEYPVPPEIERISIEGEEIKQSRLKRNLSRILALRKLCKKYKPAAIISFMAEPNFRSIIATLGLKTKSIVSVRNDPDREYAGRLGRLVGKQIIPRCAGCIFQTEDAKKWFSKKLQKKSQVIFNDVDPVFFNTEYAGGKDIVTLGRLCEQKNHALLIDAFAKIADKHPNANLLIYGIGPLEDALKEQISDLGLEARVLLMGLSTQSNLVLSSSKCFVLSSDYEGMPNALLEALAVGVPSISTDCPCGGPRCIIENGVNGYLTPVGDAGALSRAMDSLLSDEELCKSFSVKAREMSGAYRTEAVFSQWREFVEKIISK